MRLHAVCLSVFVLLCSCAELYLEQNIQSVEGENRQLDDFVDMSVLACPDYLSNPNTNNCSITGAVTLAFNQADAYARAARQSQFTQDAAFAALLGTAGWTAIGGAEGVADSVLTERAVAAVAVQQAGSRSVPQSAVQALYVGASRMNCIALAGSSYEEVDLDDLSAGQSTGSVNARFASFVMVLAMREVEYRTLHGTARGLQDFSSLLQVFTDISSSVVQIPTVEDEEQSVSEALTGSTDSSDGRTESVRVIRQNPALERFVGFVAGCLDSNNIVPNSSATTPN